MNGRAQPALHCFSLALLRHLDASAGQEVQNIAGACRLFGEPLASGRTAEDIVEVLEHVPHFSLGRYPDRLGRYCFD